MKHSDGYPELTLLVSNTGSITGIATWLVYDATDKPDCLNDGVTPPKVTYDVLLPDLQGSDVKVKLPQTYAIAPGTQGSFTLKVGRAVGSTDRCDIKPKLRLQYVDEAGKIRTSPPFEDVPPLLKVRPLVKCPVITTCIRPSLLPLPTRPPIKL